MQQPSSFLYRLLPALLFIMAGCNAYISDYEKGLAELEKGNITGSLELFTRSIEEEKEVFSSYYSRGMAFYYLGDFSRAIDDYTSALEINEDQNAYFQRAVSNIELGLYENAFADLDMAGRLNDSDIELLIRTGRGMLDLGYHLEAERIFTQALDLDPDRMEALNGRGNARIELGDSAGAEKDWNRAIEISRLSRNQ